MEMHEINVVWMHFLLFSLFTIQNLKRKKASSLALIPHFSWYNRVMIVLSLPVLLTPFPLYFWSSQNPLFIWLHPWPTFFFFFLASYGLFPKGLCSDHLTAFSEFKKETPQHRPSRGACGVPAAPSSLPSTSAQTPLLSPADTLCLGTPHSWWCSQRLQLAPGHLTWLHMCSWRNKSSSSVPQPHSSVDKDMVQVLCSELKAKTVMCRKDYSSASCCKMEWKMSILPRRL